MTGPQPGEIDGVGLVPLTAHADDRGALTEIFRRAWAPAAGEMVQANLSSSREGVLRGLHFHRSQSDYWCVISGRAFVGLYDLRGGSPTLGRRAEIRIDAEQEWVGLFIPPGVAHGFLAETDLALLYVVDREFDGTDEFGVAWNDPDIAIAWPSSEPVLSERDRSNPSLAEAAADAPAFGRPS
jgi:dTDP-4-dehydrorhamnose 3,5-epimerase